MQSCTTDMQNVTATFNQVDEDGGVALLLQGSLALHDCMLHSNTAGLDGAAVSLARSFISVEDSSFFNNTGRTGTISARVNGMLAVSNSSFVQNAGLSAGALHLILNSTGIATNCSFINNTASNLGRCWHHNQIQLVLESVPVSREQFSRWWFIHRHNSSAQHL